MPQFILWKFLSFSNCMSVNFTDPKICLPAMPLMLLQSWYQLILLIAIGVDTHFHEC